MTRHYFEAELDSGTDEGQVGSLNLNKQGNEMPHRRELDNTGIEPEHIKPFRAWLRGQTVPITEEGRIGYYRFDYERWKESKGRLLDEEVQQEEHHD